MLRVSRIKINSIPSDVNHQHQYIQQNHFIRPSLVRKMVTIGNMEQPLIMVNAPSLEADKIEWSYTEFMKEMQTDNIEAVDIYAKDLHGEFLTKDGERGKVQLIPTDHMIEDFLAHDVEVKYIREDVDPNKNFVSKFIDVMFQIIGFVFLIRLGMFLIGGNGGGRPNPFGMSNDVGKMYNENDINKKTFADVAGIENAKRDLQEVVQFLKNSDKFIEIGARIPKGVLLVGPPGTGKTLLAKAVAGEAGVPYFSCSASEFVEMFVGLGASRIRELFKKANEKAPCIIFIDEIDAIGKKRSSGGIGGANDEREQTINQLLTEMDGFNNNNGVIIIAATNRAELLDDALVRPGRFDRQVYVELPDFIGRREILKLHMSNKRIDDDVEVDSIARITMGFSGADLENLCNEAAIYAATNGKTKINKNDFSRVFDKLILGPESNTLVVTENKKKLVAYHEAGHALIGILLGDYDNIRKISIVPRGSAGGVTYFEPDEERVDMGLYTREYLENQIMVLLAGRVAEEVKFGTNKVTTGASHDFTQVTRLAIGMVTEYGFNETIGKLDVSDNIIGDAVSSDIASEVKLIVEVAYNYTKQLVEKYIIYLDAIAMALLEKEHLNPDEIIEVVNGISCDYKRGEQLFIDTSFKE